MAAVLTRMFSHGNRLLRHSTSSNQGNASSANTRAFLSNAEADISMADADDDEDEDEEEQDEEEDVEDEDPDAEGSPDMEDYPTQEQQAQDKATAEDEEYEEEGNSRAVKVRRRSGRNSGRLKRKRSESVEEEEEVESPVSPDSDKDSEDEDESEAAPWEGESEGEEEEEVAEVEVANPNRCVFCDQDEEHDPSDDFEDYLACAVCGDNAHRSCAREEKSLQTDDDAAQWRCPACVENGLEADEATSDHEHPRRRRSSSKLTRELAPVTKPGGHTIFANAIIDDEADGSRALRKRKASSESAEDKPSFVTRKRRRREVSEAVGDSVLEPIDENEDEASGRARPSRLRQNKKSTGPPFRIVEKNEDQFIVSIAYRVNWSELEHEWKKARRRARDRARRERQAQVIVQPEPDIPHFPGISLNFTAPLFAVQEKEGEEAKKPYGGILSEIEADTTRTFPQPGDRKKFEDARQKAEEEWKKKLEAARQADPAKPNAKVSGPPSRIKCINFGKFEVDTWHAAPYPEEYSRNKVLYICEFCLKYMSSDFVAWRHKLKCPAKHPPGDEIYRDGNFSFFEVDGRKNPVYCQNLCLLAKLFLGSKTLYYDVEPFLFYVMTEHDEYGEHFVGYFSKEKRPSSMNNVSCILVLPVHQRRGFGHMLIEFSYLLTKVEQKSGSPEKPLSDMGLVSYRSYWRLVLCKELLALHASNTPLSIAELSSRTGMTTDDIVCALEGLRALVRDPLTKSYALRLDMAYYRQYIENYEKKGYTKINAESLIWVPYVMGRDNMHYENAPQLTTVKQREEPDETAAAFEEVGPLEEGVQQSQGFEEAESLAVAAAEDTVEAAADPTGGAALVDDFPIDPALLALDASMFGGTETNAPIDPALPEDNDEVGGQAPQFNTSTEHAEHAVHPFPPIALTTPSKPRSPPKHLIHTSAAATITSGNPHDESHNLNGDSHASMSSASPIPPTRFEVFPVIPGMQNKRKPGRPLGRGARHRLAAGTPSRRGSPGVNLHATPVRAQSGLGVQQTPGSATMRRTRSNLSAAVSASGGGSAHGSARSLRRTRSQLHEAIALDGAADGDDGADEEEDEEMAEDMDAEGELDDEVANDIEDDVGADDEDAQPDDEDEADDPDAEGEEDVEMQE